MVVSDIYKSVRAKAIAMGIKANILTEDLFVDIFNKALRDFCIDTKCNSKHVYTDTVADQEYYTLPSDFMSPMRVMMDGIKLTPKDLSDWFDKKESDSE